MDSLIEDIWVGAMASKIGRRAMASKTGRRANGIFKPSVESGTIGSSLSGTHTGLIRTSPRKIEL